jgi:type I restriction enzyme M protein
VTADVVFFDRKPAAENPWTQPLRVYDLRINQHFTLKQNPLRRGHRQELVDCAAPGRPRSERAESVRFRSFSCDEIVVRAT